MTGISIKFDPNNFAGGPITNNFLPLAVGNTWVYQEKTPGGVVDSVEDTVTVTDKTINIDGVQCVVVNDVVQDGKKVTETTNDYFAQDKAGNVWYFGEDTKTFQPGGASTVGTWRAGVNKAEPGIIMLADPRKGDSYFEENAPGVAVDQAAVAGLNASAAVPFGTFNKDLLMTRNSSVLFPGDVESKFYAAGIGSVLEVDADGTRQELVSFTSGGASLVQAMAGFGDHGHAGTASLLQKQEHAQLADILAPHHAHNA